MVLQEASVVFHVRVCCPIEFAPRFSCRPVRLMNTDVVPFSAFLMLISVLFFKSLSALCSAGCRLFFGFVMCTSAASWIKPFLDSYLKQLIAVVVVPSLI